MFNKQQLHTKALKSKQLEVSLVVIWSEFSKMRKVKNFLDTSSIHGLIHISQNKKYSKLFWILIVIAGFSSAGVMIQKSFQSWNVDPIKTTIETEPITKIAFPKLTVCPPKNTYTNLNFDLMKLENMSLDNEIRYGLKYNFF